MSKGIILVLGGLGVKGVANIGTLQALCTHQVKIEKVITSGISSLIGAQFALGKNLDLLTEYFIRFFDENERFLWGLEQLSSLTRKRNRMVVSSLSYFLRERLFCKENVKRISVLPWDLVQTDLEAFFGNNTFSEMEVPLAVSAIDINRGKEVLIEQGNLIESLKAGIAFPGLFPPVHIGDQELVSSTLYCELPLSSMVKARQHIIAVDIPSDLSAERPYSLLEIIAQMDEVRTTAIKQKLLNKADQIFRLEKLKRFQWGSYRQIPQLISLARDNMNELLDSAEMPTC